jgi:hypothetical protein
VINLEDPPQTAGLVIVVNQQARLPASDPTTIDVTPNKPSDDDRH